MSMGYEEIKQWLDNIVDAICRLNSLRRYNSDISGGAKEDSYLISKGIDVVADVMGLYLRYEDVKESALGFTKWRRFSYKGITFYDYVKE